MDERKLQPFAMSKWRILLVNAVVLLLVFGHLFDIAKDKEHWPFSQYKLFTLIETERSLTRMQIYGVPQESSQHEFPLRWVSKGFDSSRTIDPIRQTYYSQRLKSEERQQKLNERLLDSLSTYEKRRLAGGSDWPSLQGARLYEETWSLDGQAQSMDDPPDHRQLIAEVKHP